MFGLSTSRIIFLMSIELMKFSMYPSIVSYFLMLRQEMCAFIISYTVFINILRKLTVNILIKK